MNAVTMLTQDDVFAAIERISNHDDANMIRAYIQVLLGTIERLADHLEMERADD